MRESLGSTKPTGGMKVKDLFVEVLGRILAQLGQAHCQPLRVLHLGGPRGSKSVHVGTRKMVNYA